MKIFLAIIFLILLSNCSFDNKTGIWKNSNEIDLKREDRFKDFVTLNTSQKPFNDIIKPSKNLKNRFDLVKKNTKWNDEYYQNTNALLPALILG